MMAVVEEEEEEEVRLVGRMRIDFNIIPATKDGYYVPDLMEEYIVLKVKELLGKKLGTSISIPYQDVDVHLKPSEWCIPVCTGYEDWTRADYERQLKFGDPGFLIIRDLSFVDRFDGVDWDDKFYNARQFLLQGLHYSLYVGSPPNDQSGPQFISTFLKPQEDYHILTHLISPVSPPTIILQGVPSRWLADPRFIPKLRQLFQTLIPNLRHFNTSGDRILIQCKDSEDCCNALKQLCSHSLKKNGDLKMVDYELTLTDGFVSKGSQQVPIYNSYNESATTEALKLRVEMMEKELEAMKAILKESHAGSHV